MLAGVAIGGTLFNSSIHSALPPGKGTYGAGVLLNVSQLMDLKKGCLLISSAPPAPSLFSGDKAKSLSMMSFASGEIVEAISCGHSIRLEIMLSKISAIPSPAKGGNPNSKQ